MTSTARSFPALVVAAFATAALTSSEALAAPVWVGDLETGDLSQWEGQLNGQHISIATSPVIQGMYAAQIQLTNDAVWPNGLKRVELHHSPAAGRTAEGAETYFAWSFYLPETLPTDPGQEIGYWESDQSYQQMMAFDVDGEHISFATRKPQNKVHWDADGQVTAGAWHRIALHVKWSKDQAQGLVDVWFDGAQVVTQGGAQTLADDNPHFTQVGLLRGAIEFQDAPIIFIDDALEGDTLADVHPDLANEGGGGTGGGSGGSPGTGGGTAGTSGGAGAQGGSAVTSVGAGGAPADNAAGDDGGCGCRTVRSPLESSAALVAGALALVALGRRRGRIDQRWKRTKS